MTQNVTTEKKANTFELVVWHRIAEKEMTLEEVTYFETGEDLYVEYYNDDTETLPADIVVGST